MSDIEHEVGKEVKLLTTKFFVEANSFEMFELWKQVRDEGEDHWEEDNAGFSQVIGEIGGYPVNVSFMFATINGVRICFYYGCSRVVDHVMIEEWIMKNYPKYYDDGESRGMTDATNFHHCLEYTRSIESKLHKN